MLNRWPLLIGAVTVAASAAVANGAEQNGWWSITEENNNLGADLDRYYVNGFCLTWLSPSTQEWGTAPSHAATATIQSLPGLFAENGVRDQRLEWTPLGQLIFTPADKNLSVPDPKDRPYAGMLYTGIDLLQDLEARRLDDLGVALGVVGPAALARETQNNVHHILGFGSANGWDSQLKNEPALVLNYSRKWRFVETLSWGNRVQVDVVPELGLTAGNVFDEIDSTLMVRSGWGLDASYGPRLLSPGFEGDSYFAAERGSRSGGIYGFAGIQGRAVAHNLFLDGNTWQASPSVPKYPWVHAVVAGISVNALGRLRLDLSFVHESPEFPGQKSGESYGSASLSIR